MNEVWIVRDCEVDEYRCFSSFEKAYAFMMKYFQTTEWGKKTQIKEGYRNPAQSYFLYDIWYNDECNCVEILKTQVDSEEVF